MSGYRFYLPWFIVFFIFFTAVEWTLWRKLVPPSASPWQEAVTDLRRAGHISNSESGKLRSSRTLREASEAAAKATGGASEAAAEAPGGASSALLPPAIAAEPPQGSETLNGPLPSKLPGKSSLLHRSTAAYGAQRLAAVKEKEATWLASAEAKRWPKRVGGPQPIPPLSEPGQNTTIIVEVSAFEDGERCARTMKFSLERAAVPGRVWFTVIQAIDAGHPDCPAIFRDSHLPKLCALGGRLAKGMTTEACQQQILSRIRAWAIPTPAGKGPAHQRGLASALLRYEREDDMCLSMDSHMDFQDNWDDTLILDWRHTRNEFAVLSTYPGDITRRGSSGTSWFVDLCGYDMEAGIPRGKGGGDERRDDSRAPYLSTNWAAGFSFARCHMERSVPVDWHLPWIFTGEEVDRAVRLFTNGYDIYAPTQMTVLHEYAHAKQTFWSTAPKDQPVLKAKSWARLKALLKTGPETGEDYGIFGLGTQRTLEDYVEWSRIDLGGNWGDFLKKKFPREQINWGLHKHCSHLARKPIRDEAALLATAVVAHRETDDPWPINNKGQVEIPGETPDVRPVRVI